MTLIGSLEQALTQVFQSVSQSEKKTNPGVVKKIQQLKKQLLILKSDLSSIKQRALKENS